jgi:hypothetical protein
MNLSLDLFGRRTAAMARRKARLLLRALGLATVVSVVAFTCLLSLESYDETPIGFTADEWLGTSAIGV